MQELKRSWSAFASGGQLVLRLPIRFSGAKYYTRRNVSLVNFTPNLYAFACGSVNGLCPDGGFGGRPEESRSGVVH